MRLKNRFYSDDFQMTLFFWLQNGILRFRCKKSNPGTGFSLKLLKGICLEGASFLHSFCKPNIFSKFQFLTILAFNK